MKEIKKWWCYSKWSFGEHTDQIHVRLFFFFSWSSSEPIQFSSVVFHHLPLWKQKESPSFSGWTGTKQGILFKDAWFLHRWPLQQGIEICKMSGWVLLAAFFNREKRGRIWWTGWAKKENNVLFVIHLCISSVLGIIKSFSAYELFSLPCSRTSCQEPAVRLVSWEAAVAVMGTEKVEHFLVRF